MQRLFPLTVIIIRIFPTIATVICVFFGNIRIYGYILTIQQFLHVYFRIFPDFLLHVLKQCSCFLRVLWPLSVCVISLYRRFASASVAGVLALSVLIRCVGSRPSGIVASAVGLVLCVPSGVWRLSASGAGPVCCRPGSLLCLSACRPPSCLLWDPLRASVVLLRVRVWIRCALACARSSACLFARLRAPAPAHTRGVLAQAIPLLLTPPSPEKNKKDYYGNILDKRKNPYYIIYEINTRRTAYENE